MKINKKNPGAVAAAPEVKDIVVELCLVGDYIAALPILAIQLGALV